MLSKIQTLESISIIAKMFPDAECELIHNNAFELLIAVLLSAQTTDASVNKVTPELFLKYPTPKHFVDAPIEDIENSIRRIGLYRNKSKNIKLLSNQLLEKHNGEVPNNYNDLVSLSGCGRKTANVVLSVWFSVPRIAVDTHVERVSKRLGICRWKDSVLEVEKTLMKKIPEDKWGQVHHQLIFFGRYHCTARSPKCEECPVSNLCREGKKRLRKKLS